MSKPYYEQRRSDSEIEHFLKNTKNHYEHWEIEQFFNNQMIPGDGAPWDDHHVTEVYECCRKKQRFGWNGKEVYGFSDHFDIHCHYCNKVLANIRCDVDNPKYECDV